jgi:hypothetical protein
VASGTAVPTGTLQRGRCKLEVKAEGAKVEVLKCIINLR